MRFNLSPMLALRMTRAAATSAGSSSARLSLALGQLRTRQQMTASRRCCFAHVMRSAQEGHYEGILFVSLSDQLCRLELSASVDALPSDPVTLGAPTGPAVGVRACKIFFRPLAL